MFTDEHRPAVWDQIRQHDLRAFAKWLSANQPPQRAGREVDFVLEGAGDQLVGIEVKATATLDRKDFRGLDDLAQATGKRFHRGILLYTGSEVIPFTRNLHALPVSALWHVGSEQVPE